MHLDICFILCHALILTLSLHDLFSVGKPEKIAPTKGHLGRFDPEEWVSNWMEINIVLLMWSPLPLWSSWMTLWILQMIWHGFLYSINYHWPPQAEKRRLSLGRVGHDQGMLNILTEFLFFLDLQDYFPWLWFRICLSLSSVFSLFLCVTWWEGCFWVIKLWRSSNFKPLFIKTYPSLDFQAAACPLPNRRPNEGSSEAMMLALVPFLGRPTSASDRQGTTTSSSAVVPHLSSLSLIL